MSSQILLSSCFCYSRKAPLDNSTSLVATVPCGHVLHKTCLLEWWKTREEKKCPSCNQRVPITSSSSYRQEERGYVDLFGLEIATTATTGSGGGNSEIPSSDGLFTQDTQQVLEELVSTRMMRKRRKLGHKNDKGKGKMIIHDDEEEEEEERGLRELERKLKEVEKEKQTFEIHSKNLEDQLKQLEDENDVLKAENEDLNEQLNRLDADVLEELEEVNRRLEQEAKEREKKIRKLKVKLDIKDNELRERISRVDQLEHELSQEGDSGRMKIQELENQIGSLQDDLMHARREKDKLELDMAKVKKTCQTRINQTKEDEARALQELEKERELTKSVIMGNKNYEHKLKRAKETINRLQNELQKKKGKINFESDSEDGGDLPIEKSPPRSRTTSSSSFRQPLVSTSSHNLLVDSSPHALPAFKIKNHSSLISPVKVNRSTTVTRVHDDDEEDEEDDIYAPTAEDDNSSEIEIIEPNPPLSMISAKQNQSTSSSYKSEPPVLPIASKYFSSAPQSQIQKNLFPSLTSTSRTGTGGGGNVLGNKRTFERSKSDKYLPDFGRERVAVQTGPKRKVKRM
ncbi:hypothetical protein JCM5350_007297 [Sporobolomyces pararoseus]